MVVLVQYKAPGYGEIRIVVSDLSLRMYSLGLLSFFPSCLPSQ